MTIMPYKKLSAASLVLTPLLIASTGWSNTISVGGTQLVIPDPPGFAAVTAQMPTVYRLRQQQVAPGNEQFICFIPELDIPNAMKDGLPRSARWFSVQTPKETVGISFSKTNFSELTQVLRTQIDELCGQVEKEAPGLLERVNKGLTKEFGVDLGSVSQMVPLTPP